jgi:hypothetical protein
MAVLSVGSHRNVVSNGHFGSGGQTGGKPVPLKTGQTPRKGESAGKSGCYPQ